MRLYHGSNIAIDSINLAMCRPYKDFGKGFYLTDIKEQAEKMAVRVSKIYGGSPIVNTYEIQDDFRKIKSIAIKDFGLETTEEWAKFVMNNRSRIFTNVKDTLCNKDRFYNSKVFEKLQDKETGLYMESSEYVYDLFKDEMNFGRIVQAEI